PLATTCAPALASSTEMARPIPWPAPVTIATRSRSIPDARALSGQVCLEEGDGALPRQLGGWLVVARRRVVVEAVLGARVDVHLIRHPGGRQRGLERGPHLVDPLVGLGVVDQERRLDPRSAGGVGRRPVERHAGA